MRINISTKGLILVIICISVVLASLTLVYVYMHYPHSTNNDHEQENPHQPSSPPSFDFEYTVTVNISTPTETEFYLIVPFPSQLYGEIPEPIKDGLYIANGSGSFFINDSIDINRSYYNLGLQINTSGNITIKSVGRADYAFIDHMSLIVPGNSSYSHEYWVYSSFHGNLTVDIYAKSSKLGLPDEHEAEISGNVTYGWNLVKGFEWDIVY